MTLELTDDEKNLLRQLVNTASPSMNVATARVFVSLVDKINAATEDKPNA